MITGPFSDSLTGCARCHGSGHLQIQWKPLTHASVLYDRDYHGGYRELLMTHWGICPATNEPIMFFQTMDDDE